MDMIQEMEEIRERMVMVQAESMRESMWPVARKLVPIIKSIDVVLNLLSEEKDDSPFNESEIECKRDFLWDADSQSIRVQAADKYDHPIHIRDWLLLIPKMTELLHQTRSIRTGDLRKYLYDENKVTRCCKHRPKMGQCRHAPELVCDLLATAEVLKRTKHGEWGCSNIEVFRLSVEKVLLRLQRGEVITRTWKKD